MPAQITEKMVMGPCYKKEKPFFVRALSAFLILTFLSTQTDFHLAFAHPAALPVSNLPSPENLGLQDQKEDVHYSQDLSRMDNPLSPAPSQTNEAAQKAKNVSTPEVPKNILFKQDNPLAHPDGQEQKDDVVIDGKAATKHSYQNKSSFTVGKTDQKIYQIQDFTGPNGEIEVRDFIYSQENGLPPQVRIHTVSGTTSNRLESYQTFLMDSNGNVDNLLESGYVVQGQLIRQKVYHHDTNRLDVYDPQTGLTKAAYELDPTGEPLRLISYESKAPSSPSNIEIRYDDTKNEATVIDRVQQTFEVHALVDGKELGDLKAMGTLKKGAQGAEELKIEHLVEIEELTQGNETIHAYVFTESQNPDYLLVREMLPNGGMGRVLRVSGLNEAGNKIDQEYFYEKDAVSGHDILTVFNYEEGTFLKIELLKNDPDHSKPQELNSTDIRILSGGIMTSKKLQDQKVTFTVVNGKVSVSDVSKNHFSTNMNSLLSLVLGLVPPRGPPAESLKFNQPSALSLHDRAQTLLNLEIPKSSAQDLLRSQNKIQFYDLANHLLKVIDNTNHTIQIYQLQDDGKTPGALVDSGFYNDGDQTYSLQKTGETETRFYSYGVDGLIFTSDDTKTEDPRKKNRPASQGFDGKGLGGGNPELDDKIRDLNAMVRTYSECVSERGKDDVDCQKIEKNIGGLISTIEDLSQKGLSLGRLDSSGGGGGARDLNYGSPALAPELLPDIIGFGSAPVNVPGAKVTENPDQSVSIELNGAKQIWWKGSDGALGTGDDELSQIIRKDANNVEVHWMYERKSRRLSQIIKGGKQIASYQYDDTSHVLTIEQSNGSKFVYSYANPSHPIGSRTLRQSSFTDQVGEKWTQSYNASGRIESVKNETKNEITAYHYDDALNQVTLTLANGKTRIENLGGDRTAGTGDDFIVGGTDSNLEIQKQNGNIIEIRDLSKRTVTSFVDQNGQITITSHFLDNVGMVQQSVLNLGADGKFGTVDDIFQSAAGLENGHAFAEIFDAQGHLLSWEGWKVVSRTGNDGSYLDQNGSPVLTEEEAAKVPQRQRITYGWNNTANQVTVSSYAIKADGNPENDPASRFTYELGGDKLFHSSDDHLIFKSFYDNSRKTFFEESYDSQSRVILHRNVSSGNEIRYKFDDTAHKVTISSSIEDFSQTFEFDDAHPNDLHFARLLVEKRALATRTWDKNQKLTSVTDKNGITTLYKNGQITAIVDKNGKELRKFTQYVDSLTGRITDVGFDTTGDSFITISLGDRDGNGYEEYQTIYAGGVIKRYERNERGQVLNEVSDTQGMEFTWKLDSKSGKLTVSFNSGAGQIYSQVNGQYQIKESTSLLGEKETYYYYDEKGLIGPSNKTAKNDADLDYIVREDGTVVYYRKDSNGKTEIDKTTESGFVDRVVSPFGDITTYVYSDADSDGHRTIRETIEKRGNGVPVSVTRYDAEGRVTASYNYTLDGTKINIRREYSYYSDDKENDDFRMLKEVRQFNVSDLQIASVAPLSRNDVIARNPQDDEAISKLNTGGWLQSMVKYLPHSDGNPKTFREDNYRAGLIDVVLQYKKPTSDAKVLDSLVYYEYQSVQLLRTVTYKPGEESGSCENLSACRADSIDQYTYLAGTNKVDFIQRSKVMDPSKSLNGTNLKIVQTFRQEEIDDFTGITHDFGEDGVEGGTDDKFIKNIRKIAGDDVDGDPETVDYGTETQIYDDANVVKYANGLFKYANFSHLLSHNFQFDVNGDGARVKSKNIRIRDGKDTDDATYSEQVQKSRTDTGFDGKTSLENILLGTLKDDLNWKYEPITLSRTFRGGFDHPQDQFLLSEGYQINSRDEIYTHSSNRNPQTGKVTFQEQRKTHKDEKDVLLDPSKTIRQRIIGDKLNDPNWKDESIFQVTTYAEDFSAPRIAEDVTYQITSKDQDFTRSASMNLKTKKFSFTEIQHLPKNLQSFTAGNIVNGIDQRMEGKPKLKKALLGDLASDANWIDESIELAVESEDAFDEAIRDTNERYQITSRDQKETYSASYDKNAQRFVFSLRRQVNPETKDPQFNSVATPEPDEIGALIQTGLTQQGLNYKDPVWKNQDIYYSESSLDAINQASRVVSNSGYQISSKDGESSLSLNRTPLGEVIWNFQTKADLSAASIVSDKAVGALWNEVKAATGIVPDDRNWQNRDILYVRTTANALEAATNQYLSSQGYQIASKNGLQVYSISQNHKGTLSITERIDSSRDHAYNKTFLLNSQMNGINGQGLLESYQEQIVRSQNSTDIITYALSANAKDRNANGIILGYMNQLQVSKDLSEIRTYQLNKISTSRLDEKTLLSFRTATRQDADTTISRNLLLNETKTAPATNGQLLSYSVERQIDRDTTEIKTYQLNEAMTDILPTNELLAYERQIRLSAEITEIRSYLMNVAKTDKDPAGKYFSIQQRVRVDGQKTEVKIFALNAAETAVASSGELLGHEIMNQFNGFVTEIENLITKTKTTNTQESATVSSQVVWDGAGTISRQREELVNARLTQATDTATGKVTDRIQIDANTTQSVTRTPQGMITENQKVVRKSSHVTEITDQIFNTKSVITQINASTTERVTSDSAGVIQRDRINQINGRKSEIENLETHLVSVNEIIDQNTTHVQQYGINQAPLGDQTIRQIDAVTSESTDNTNGLITRTVQESATSSRRTTRDAAGIIRDEHVEQINARQTKITNLSVVGGWTLNTIVDSTHTNIEQFGTDARGVVRKIGNETVHQIDSMTSESADNISNTTTQTVQESATVSHRTTRDEKGIIRDERVEQVSGRGTKITNIATGGWTISTITDATHTQMKQYGVGAGGLAVPIGDEIVHQIDSLTSESSDNNLKSTTRTVQLSASSSRRTVTDKDGVIRTEQIDQLGARQTNITNLATGGWTVNSTVDLTHTGTQQFGINDKGRTVKIGDESIHQIDSMTTESIDNNLHSTTRTVQESATSSHRTVTDKAGNIRNERIEQLSARQTKSANLSTGGWTINSIIDLTHTHIEQYGKTASGIIFKTADETLHQINSLVTETIDNLHISTVPLAQPSGAAASAPSGNSNGMVFLAPAGSEYAGNFRQTVTWTNQESAVSSMRIIRDSNGVVTQERVEQLDARRTKVTDLASGNWTIQNILSLTDMQMQSYTLNASGQGIMSGSSVTSQINSAITETTDEIKHTTIRRERIASSDLEQELANISDPKKRSAAQAAFQTSKDGGEFFKVTETAADLTQTPSYFWTLGDLTYYLKVDEDHLGKWNYVWQNQVALSTLTQFASTLEKAEREKFEEQLPKNASTQVTAIHDGEDITYRWETTVHDGVKWTHVLRKDPESETKMVFTSETQILLSSLNSPAMLNRLPEDQKSALLAEIQAHGSELISEVHQGGQTYYQWESTY
ncbi:MAG: hypothetical protein EXS63_08805, partial [Candidatus Omnitrophica bacterium]|nr:hypothetical protein [Candidatus Omnitrophota bacterium]